MQYLAKQLVILIGTLAVILSAGTSGAVAGNLMANLTTSKGDAARDVVLLLIPQDASNAARTPHTAQSTEVEVVQKNFQFAPYVLPVQKGTSVSFPNKDKARHHVYSFSKTKRFELQLYGGDESRAVVFDKSGIVALGCNIHDNMLAYVVVADTPYYAVSDDKGHITVNDIEPGAYTARIWHPDMSHKKSPIEKSVLISQAETVDLQLSIDIKSRATRPSSDRRDETGY